MSDKPTNKRDARLARRAVKLSESDAQKVATAPAPEPEEVDEDEDDEDEDESDEDEDSDDEDGSSKKKEDTVLETTELGKKMRGTFRISIPNPAYKKSLPKSEENKPFLYRNKKEEFDYFVSDGFINAARMSGAKFTDEQVEVLSDFLKPVIDETTGKETEESASIGKAFALFTSQHNKAQKIRAKSLKDQNIRSKHIVLDGAQKETAQSQMIRSAMQTQGIDVETAILRLKSVGFLPADFTQEHIVPLKRRKA